MKKLLLLTVVMLISLGSYAQIKGDMFFGAAISAEFGYQEVVVSQDHYSTSTKQPLNASFGCGVEYGYFIANNLRLALALSVPFYSTPTEEYDGKWLKNKITAVAVNPNFAYYVRLAERLYYTPEIGAIFNFCSAKNQLTESKSHTGTYWGWNAYVNILALEFKVSEKVAIGAIIGGIRYGSVIYNDKATDTKSTVNQLNFGFNNSSVQFRLYF